MRFTVHQPERRQDCELCEREALVIASVEGGRSHLWCREHLRSRLFERVELAASMWRVGLGHSSSDLLRLELR